MNRWLLRTKTTPEGPTGIPIAQSLFPFESKTRSDRSPSASRR